jgi:pimeloyl-ACP methyl ester carboxylesterase
MGGGGDFPSFDGVKLHVDIEGDGQAVVLLHSFATNTERNWHRPGIIDALVAAGCRVLGLDARGHGRSEKRYDPAAYRNEAMARDVAALLDHEGLEKADVVGHGMGSVTAVFFTLRDDRVRRLVLAGLGGSLNETSAMLARWGRRIVTAMDAEDVEQIEDPQAQRVRRFADHNCADRQALAALWRGPRPVPLTRKELSAIAVPTLVISGDQGPSAHDIAAVLQHGQARTVAGDRVTAVSDPAFARAIVEFLTAT